MLFRSTLHGAPRIVAASRFGFFGLGSMRIISDVSDESVVVTIAEPTGEMKRWAARIRWLLRPHSALGIALVTPLAHVANNSLDFQTYLYAIFHRSAVARLVHAFLVPATLTALLALVASFSVPLAVLSVTALVFWYIRLAATHRMYLLAAIAALTTTLLFFGALAWANGESSLATPGWWLLGLGFALTLSHGAERDVPPRVSGTAHWVPIGEYFRRDPVARLFRSALMLVAGTANEMWASWRLWPVVILDALWSLGYQPQRRAAMIELVKAACVDNDPAIDAIGTGGASLGDYP